MSVSASAYGGGVAVPTGNFTIEQKSPGNADIKFLIHSNDTVVLNQVNEYSETRLFKALLPKRVGCGLILDNAHIYDSRFKIYAVDAAQPEKGWKEITEAGSNTGVQLLDNVYTYVNDMPNVECMTELNIAFAISNNNAVDQAWCDYIICYDAKLNYSVCYNLVGCERFTVRLSNVSDVNSTLADTTVPDTTNPIESTVSN